MTYLNTRREGEADLGTKEEHRETLKVVIEVLNDIGLSIINNDLLVWNFIKRCSRRQRTMLW